MYFLLQVDTWLWQPSSPSSLLARKEPARLQTMLRIMAASHKDTGLNSKYLPSCSIPGTKRASRDRVFTRDLCCPKSTCLLAPTLAISSSGWSPKSCSRSASCPPQRYLCTGSCLPCLGLPISLLNYLLSRCQGSLGSNMGYKLGSPLYLLPRWSTSPAPSVQTCSKSSTSSWTKDSIYLATSPSHRAEGICSPCRKLLIGKVRAPIAAQQGTTTQVGQWR